MFYKVATNIELVNTMPLLSGEIQGQVLRASGHTTFVNWSIYNCILCLFLFKDMLFNIYCWFVNPELVANSTGPRAWMKPIKHLCFLWKAHSSLLALRNDRQHFSTTLEGHFKHQNHQRKAQKCEKHVLKRPKKDTCLQCGNWKRKAKCHHFLPQLQMCNVQQQKFFTIVHMFTNGYKVPRVLILGVPVHFSKLANSWIQNEQIMMINCTCVYSLIHFMQGMSKCGWCQGEQTGRNTTLTGVYPGRGHRY